MKGPDIVLGIQWLQTLGKVTHDYSQQTMEFTLSCHEYTLRGDEALCMKRINLHHMWDLMETDDVYGVYEVYKLGFDKDEREGKKPKAKANAHLEIIMLLAFWDTFSGTFHSSSTS